VILGGEHSLCATTPEVSLSRVVVSLNGSDEWVSLGDVGVRHDAEREVGDRATRVDEGVSGEPLGRLRRYISGWCRREGELTSVKFARRIPPSSRDEARYPTNLLSTSSTAR